VTNLQPRYRLFLDALIAAVFLTIVGLTLFVFFQAPSSSRFTAHLNPMVRLPHIFPIIVEIDGRVESSELHEGSQVYRGDVLVQLDTRELISKKRSLERLIHFAEDHHANTSKLYRELEQTRLDLVRHTISTPDAGRLILAPSLQPGDILQRGSAIAVQVIESHYAGYSLWPSLHR
jgi:multidrug resistance efflux pump